MKLRTLLFACLFTGSLMAQPIQKTMKRLPDTGQVNSYTTTFGEDHDYSINPPGFVVNGNGTVTDTVTGLMWQQTDGGEMTIEKAFLYADTLTLAGFSDWRLPSAHESFSILNHQHTNPALDLQFFTSTNAAYWWSSQFQANDPTKVWCTNAGGGIGNHPKTETVSAGGNKKIHARVVRNLWPANPVQNHYSNNADGTLFDSLTGLTWKRQAEPDSLTWEEALSFAESSSFANYLDWRLPNIKEIQSINDESLVNPSFDPILFPGMGIRRIWSSTSLPNQTSKAWYLDTRFGITTYADKTTRQYVVLVRGGNEITEVSDVVSGEQRIQIYPNPSKGIFEVSSNHTMEEIMITDPLGRLVYSLKPNGCFASIRSSVPGIYLLRIHSGKKTELRTVIVEN